MQMTLPSARQRGTTLIGLMIGLIISSIVLLATMMLFQRTGRAMGDARRDAQVDTQRSAAFLSVDMALQDAGYGIPAAQIDAHLVVLKDANLSGASLTGAKATASDIGNAVIWAENTTGHMRCWGLLASNSTGSPELLKLGPVSSCTDASGFNAHVWTSHVLYNTEATITWSPASCSSFGIAPIPPVSGSAPATQKVLLTLSSKTSNGVALQTSQCLNNISSP